MIRIQLRARRRGPRGTWVWGLLLGLLLGGAGAWWAGADPGLLGRLTARWAAAPSPSVPIRVPPAAGLDLPRGSDAPLRILALAARVPSSATVLRVVGTAGGRYAVEGRAASAHQLDAGLADLRQGSVEARLTHWRSGAATDVGFRYAGRVLGEPAPELEPLAPTLAQGLIARLHDLAEASGMGAVAVAAEGDSSFGAGVYRRRWTLAAAGTASQVQRLVQDLETFGAQLCLSRIDVTWTPAGQQLEARIDMVVTRAAGDER